MWSSQIGNSMLNIILCVQLTKAGLRISTLNLLQQETIENKRVLLWLDLYSFFLIFAQVVGLTLSRGLDELALIYLATIQAIAVSHFKCIKE